jgi:hypothetical protein
MSGYTGVGRDALIVTIERLKVDNDRLREALTVELVQPLLHEWHCTHESCGARADIDQDVEAIPHLPGCPLAAAAPRPRRTLSERPPTPPRFVTKADA